MRSAYVSTLRDDVAAGDGLQLPVMGLLTMGAAIAAGVTGELFRRSETNRSNQSGSLGGLLFISIAGAFLAAWIFRAAAAGETVSQFILTLAAAVILFFGTGIVLRYNDAGTVFKELNPLLHSELRLAVMSILIGVESADFVFIRQQTGATAGNLSVQLDKLAKANYIEIEKTFRGKMPCTVCRITDAGRDAFAEYVAALQTYIRK